MSLEFSENYNNEFRTICRIHFIVHFEKLNVRTEVTVLKTLDMRTSEIVSNACSCSRLCNESMTKHCYRVKMTRGDHFVDEY